MFRTPFAVFLLLFCAAAQEPGETPDLPPPQADEVLSVDDLIRFVEGRETAVESVTMGIETEGEFPDGSRFSTTGTLRVLGGTHFHQQMSARLGTDMEFETETVRTPEGVWMREKDPIQGEVFLHMDPPTMARVESATEVLGEGGLGGMDGRAESPLGSAMLRDLARQFELDLSGPKAIDGAECWVLAGKVRGGGDAPEDVLGTGADRVDVVVRVSDAVIASMTQFQEGRPLIQVRIRDLVLAPELDPASFALSVAPRTDPIDVMEHPPTQAQLQALFERAAEQGWEDPAATDEEPPEDAEPPVEEPR